MLEIEIFIGSSDGTAEEKAFMIPDEIFDLEDYYYELLDEQNKEPVILEVSDTNAIHQGTSIKSVIALFSSMTIEEMVTQTMLDSGDYIYDISMLDDELSGKDPYEIVVIAKQPDFNPNDAYFYYDGYNNIETLDESGRLERMMLFIDEAIDNHL